MILILSLIDKHRKHSLSSHTYTIMFTPKRQLNSNPLLQSNCLIINEIDQRSRKITRLRSDFWITPFGTEVTLNAAWNVEKRVQTIYLGCVLDLYANVPK